MAADRASCEAQWEHLPGATLQALVQQLSMEDYQSVRLVCVVWMAAARCRHLRLTLSCVEHEHVWCGNPRWLSEFLARGRLHVTRLRLLHVPLGHGRGTAPRTEATLPASLHALAVMIEQAPASVGEVQLVLSPQTWEGLDTGPPLSPAWVACVARMSRCSPMQHSSSSSSGSSARALHLHPLQHEASPTAGLRRLQLDATALQQGYCGLPGSACMSDSVLQQLAADVPSLSSLSLSVRTSGQAAAQHLATMSQLQELRLRWEETLSPGVGAAGPIVAANGALVYAATLAAAAAASGAAVTRLVSALDSDADAFRASFLSPLTALTSLRHLSAAMSFPSFCPGAAHRRRGSSAWLLQLLPSFPQLRQLELTLVLQDVAALLTRRPADDTATPGSAGGGASRGGSRQAGSAAAGYSLPDADVAAHPAAAHRPIASSSSSSSTTQCQQGWPWSLHSVFPPGALPHLQRAAVRVRGYAGAEDASCACALEALAQGLASLPRLQHLTLGVCTAQAACDVSQGVWQALLQQPGRHGPPLLEGDLPEEPSQAAPGPARASQGPGTGDRGRAAQEMGLSEGAGRRFMVSLELSSECSRFGAFGLPNPLLHGGAREGTLLLPFEQLSSQLAPHQQRTRPGAQVLAPAGDTSIAPIAANPVNRVASKTVAPAGTGCCCDAQVCLPSLPFPLGSLRVTRSPPDGFNNTNVLGHHQLLLLPRHLALLSRLYSLTELHLEFQAAALAPAAARRLVQAVLGSPARHCTSCGARSGSGRSGGNGGTIPTGSTQDCMPPGCQGLLQGKGEVKRVPVGFAADFKGADGQHWGQGLSSGSNALQATRSRPTRDAALPAWELGAVAQGGVAGGGSAVSGSACSCDWLGSEVPSSDSWRSSSCSGGSSFNSPCSSSSGSSGSGSGSGGSSSRAGAWAAGAGAGGVAHVGRCCAGATNSRDGSCLLWLANGLPLLRSLYLRAHGSVAVGCQDPLLPPSPPQASSTNPACGLQPAEAGPNAWVGQLPAPPGFGGMHFLGDAIGSAFQDLMVDEPASQLPPPPLDLLPPGGHFAAAASAPGGGGTGRVGTPLREWGLGCSGGLGAGDTAWLRFDDECAAAFAKAWGVHMVELQLIGLDMQGLTPVGLAALEAMPLLQALALTKAPPVGKGPAGSGAAHSGAFLLSPY